MNDKIIQNELAAVAPKCIRNTPKPDCFAQPLTRNEFEAAKQDLANKKWVNYPQRRTRRRDPPLNSQNYALFSFTPSTGAKADDDGCFGVLKIRGTFPNEEEADEWMNSLIQIDTYNEIIMTTVGNDIPLTNEDRFCTETREIDLQTKVDKVTKEHVKNEREKERQAEKEIEQRREELIKDTTEVKEESVDDIEYYTKLQVKRAALLSRIDSCRKVILESQELISKTEEQLAELDKEHPDYAVDYKKRYNDALEKAGIPPEKNALQPYLK